MQDDDDDDLEFEEFLELSESQQDAILDREMALLIEQEARWAAITPLIEQYRRYRKRRLESIMQWRRVMKKLPLGDYGRQLLRERQMGLLKIRTFRDTGQWPTTA